MHALQEVWGDLTVAALQKVLSTGLYGTPYFDDEIVNHVPCTFCRTPCLDTAPVCDLFVVKIWVRPLRKVLCLIELRE